MNSSKKERLDHARHNESACRSLAESRHWDWVVTTAFYVAVHYTQYRLFPLRIDGNQVDDFGDYGEHRNRLGDRSGKHRIQSLLIRKRLRKASASYNRLRDQSWAARYQRYRVTEAEARAALGDLARIKVACGIDESAA